MGETYDSLQIYEGHTYMSVKVVNKETKIRKLQDAEFTIIKRLSRWLDKRRRN